MIEPIVFYILVYLTFCIISRLSFGIASGYYEEKLVCMSDSFKRKKDIENQKILFKIFLIPFGEFIALPLVILFTLIIVIVFTLSYITDVIDHSIDKIYNFGKKLKEKKNE
jgi:hypothetical protein